MTALLLSSMNHRKRISCHTSLRVLECVVLAAIIVMAMMTVLSVRLLYDTSSSSATNIHHNTANNVKKDIAERMVVYDLQPGMPVPRFGDEIPDPIRSRRMFVPSSRQNDGVLLPTIDQVHRRGLYHTGTWQHVMDRDHRLLLLQRGPQLITCPNAWALPGEHTLGWERPLETAQRGMQEELGVGILQQVESYQLLTPDPVYYIREYGPENANRVDRQIVYLWWIPLTVPASEVVLELDEEVADYQWISLPELEEKIRQVKQQQEHGDGSGGLDKGDTVWYCDTSLLRLYELGISKLKERLRARESKSTT